MYARSGGLSTYVPEPNVQLPQVCRQIYFETAILFYTTDNIFEICSYAQLKLFHKILNIAQREAVTNLRLFAHGNQSLKYWSIDLHNAPGSVIPLQKMFKRLKKVELIVDWQCVEDNMLDREDALKVEYIGEDLVVRM